MGWGRGRIIRRGYSLEVIFEEDVDFCSHLDSLDSVAIRFGVKEVDDTISLDSLVEEYQIKFQSKSDKEHVFKSLDGIWDVSTMDSSCFVEWDDFPVSKKLCDNSREEPKLHNGSASSKFGGNMDIPSSGRTSRVSRRQIVEATWLFDSDDNESSGSGGSTDEKEARTGQNKVEEDIVEEEAEIKPVLNGDPPPPSIKKQVLLINNSGKPLFDIRLEEQQGTKSANSRASDKAQHPPPAIFDNLTKFSRMIASEKDTLDSYLSTRTDETEANAYTFADSDHFNDSASVASTAYDSSASSSSAGSVCTVNGPNYFQPKRNGTDANKCRASGSVGNDWQSRISQLSTDCNNKEAENCSSSGVAKTDVKKVRALFENSTSPRASSMDEDSPASQGSGSMQRIYAKKPASPTNSTGSVGGVHKRIKQLGSFNQSQHDSGRFLRPAFSQYNISQDKPYPIDFAELLVNERVVIEESADILKTLKRHKDRQPRTLRRSRSMGTGLSAIEASLFSSKDFKSSKTNIPTDELPARDTVKNVRTVFEEILRSRSVASPSEPVANSFCIVKKSLSSVKSNPTSKIYRSESMRDDFPSSCRSASLSGRRFGKPVLMTEGSASSILGISPFTFLTSESPPKSKHAKNPMSPGGKNKGGVRKHPPVERQHSEPIQLVPNPNCPSPYFHEPDPSPLLILSENESSLSSFTDINDDTPPKFVSQEVLQKIRSCGSTTTYFGGQVIDQQCCKIRQQKISASRRHTLLDLKFSPLDIEFFSHSHSTTPRSSVFSISPSKYYDTDEYFTPPPIPTHLEESLSIIADCNIYASNEEEIVPMPKLLPRRDYPGVEDIFELGSNLIDTTPRIISVLPKSPSASPTKSTSPVGSIIEGRRTPEGCEEYHTLSQWTNEIRTVAASKPTAQDSNNNDNLTTNYSLHGKGKGRDSEESEGAWF